MFIPTIIKMCKRSSGTVSLHGGEQGNHYLWGHILIAWDPKGTRLLNSLWVTNPSWNQFMTGFSLFHLFLHLPVLFQILIVSHLDCLDWLQTGLPISVTILTLPHMPYTPINPSCTLWPVLFACFTKTQISLGHSFASTFHWLPSSCFQDEFHILWLSNKASQSHSPFSSPSALLGIRSPAVTAISQESLFWYRLFYKPLLGQPIPGRLWPSLNKYNPRPPCLCFTSGAFCFVPGGFSNLVK